MGNKRTSDAQDGQQAFPGKGHTKDEELRQLQKENQRLKNTVEILKKAVGILDLPIRSPQKLLERYLFVQEHYNEFNIALLCQVMEVSVSGYYAWRKRPASKRKEENGQIVKEMKVIHKQSRNTYGSPRM